LIPSPLIFLTYCASERSGRRLDVPALQRASEAMRGPRTSRQSLDSREVAVGSDGESGLENIDAEGGDLVSETEFFFVVHGAAGDCSPSRRVVSKKMIWFWFGLGIEFDPRLDVS